MLNNRLESLREEIDLSLIDMAKELGVSDSMYSRWEKGRELIPARRIYQIANYYKISIDYILGLSKEKQNILSDSEINYDLVSNRALEIRQDYGESLRTFAKRLNTSSSTWSAYETGKVLILSAFIYEICKFGGYSADWILGRSDVKFRSDLFNNGTNNCKNL